MDPKLSPPTKRVRRHFSVEEKNTIINIFKSFANDHPESTKVENVRFTAKASGIARSSVYNILKEYAANNHTVQPPRKYHRTRAVLDNVTEEEKNLIRRIVHSFFLINETPTLSKVLHAVNECDDLPNFKKATFRKLLLQIDACNSSSIDSPTPSTSTSSPPPIKKPKILQVVETSSKEVTDESNFSATSNSSTITQNSDYSSQNDETPIFDTIMIKSEVEETADDVKIKVEMGNDDSVTSFSLENITKTEIKHEDEDHEDTSDCFTDESQDFELKTEELIIKDESEAASTSSATQTDSSHDDKHAAVSDEVERLLAQLRPKKKTIKGPQAQFTDNDVFQFTITLLRGKRAPRIWRCFQVPVTYTFREFHIAIQKAMGWKSVDYDYHLHAFHLINPSTGFQDNIVMTEDVGFYSGAKDENVTKIKDYFTVGKHKGRYEYDFGIGWEHEYVFEGAFPRVEGRTYPVCLRGAKACPPEDGVVHSDEEYDSDAFDAEACF
ncbi:hypothetical protein Zmor_022205 [Zophobas morio]|uniref:Plasmid pRiA4b Orf3-like domain-containing protein n=1 Tax=Zophobas morio TaxID=2755281 RepID=A0AA38HW76_9CUCU|nr:hypothetical protein Zmor_022205 [Zophobas morio]